MKRKFWLGVGYSFMVILWAVYAVVSVICLASDVLLFFNTRFRPWVAFVFLWPLLLPLYLPDMLPASWATWMANRCADFMVKWCDATKIVRRHGDTKTCQLWRLRNETLRMATYGDLGGDRAGD